MASTSTKVAMSARRSFHGSSTAPALAVASCRSLTTNSHQPRVCRSWLDLREWDCQREPRIPAVRPVLRVEFLVALEVEVPLLFADLEEPTGLRSDPPDLRLEVAEDRAGTAVPGELVVDITDHTGM